MGRKHDHDEKFVSEKLWLIGKKDVSAKDETYAWNHKSYVKRHQA